MSVAMKRWSWIVVVVLLAGCEEPRLNASSEETFKVSLERMRSSLDPARRTALTASLNVLVSEAKTEHYKLQPSSLAADFGFDPRATLDGLTAAEILSRAKPLLEQRQHELITLLEQMIEIGPDMIADKQAEIAGLEAQVLDMQARRERLAKLAMTPPQLAGYRSYKSPTLKFRVANQLDMPITGIVWTSRLVSPGRTVPWQTSWPRHHTLQGGLEPGESREVSVDNIVSAVASQMIDNGTLPPDSRIEIVITKVVGTNGEVLAELKPDTTYLSSRLARARAELAQSEQELEEHRRELATLTRRLASTTKE